MRESSESTYAAMRESETEALRREIRRLQARIADLESQIARDQRREERKLRLAK